MGSYNSTPVQNDGVIRITVNGVQHELGPEVSPSMRLAPFLRDVLRLKGTKTACFEGGCGACVVAATRYDPVTKSVRTHSLNSCLVPLYALDGVSITTIEGLGNKQDGYHPLQQEMAKQFATQCGYCTPGATMAIYSTLAENPNASAKEVDDSLGGVICRCTGYRSILDAAQEIRANKTVVDIEDLQKQCPKTGKACQGTCASSTEIKQRASNLLDTSEEGNTNNWYRPTTLDELYTIMEQRPGENIQFMLGNTALALNPQRYSAFVVMHNIGELYDAQISADFVRVGSNVSLTSLSSFLLTASNQREGFSYLGELGRYIGVMANKNIRNMGGWAGNLTIKKAMPEFSSDVFTAFETVGATLTIGNRASSADYTPLQFLTLDMSGKVILRVNFPSLPSDTNLRFIRVNPALQDTVPYVTGGFRFRVQAPDYIVQETPQIVFGGISNTFVHATNTEAICNGKSLINESDLQEILQTLEGEVQPVEDIFTASVTARNRISVNILYKYVLGVLGTNVPPYLRSGGEDLTRGVSSGVNDFPTNPIEYPYTQPLPKLDGLMQTAGEAQFVNDIPRVDGELVGYLIESTEADATIANIDSSAALAMEGVHAVIAARDVPGVNNFMPRFASDIFPFSARYNFPDYGRHLALDHSPILAVDKVSYHGQPIAIVVAESLSQAVVAAQAVNVTYINQRPAVVSVQQAIEEESYHPNYPFPLDVTFGNPPAAMSSATHVVDGEIFAAHQEHNQIENHVALVIPAEDRLEVYTASQSTHFAQQALANATNRDASSIQVYVRRLGGAFGGKVTKANHFTTACGVAAHVLNRPVRLNVSMRNDFRMTGKRPSMLAKYKAGFDDDGKISVIEVEIYMDLGLTRSESFILYGMRTSLDGAYHIPNYQANFHMMKTNTAQHTSMRSPSGVPSRFVIETILEHVAKYLKKDSFDVKQLNFAVDGQRVLTGQQISNSTLQRIWDEVLATAEVASRKAEVAAFNANNRWKKRGLSTTPMRYGLVFQTDKFMAQLAVYETDGTIGFGISGVDVGTSINSQCIQLAASLLGVPVENFTLIPHNTYFAPNVTGTYGGKTIERCMQAVNDACTELNNRLQPFRVLNPNADWKTLINRAFNAGVDLAVRAYEYQLVPNEIYRYTTWAVAIAESEVDILTGQHMLRRVDILYDTGKSVNPLRDLTQVQGAFVQGYGQYTQEKVILDPNTAAVISDSTLRYHVMTSHDIPVDFRVALLKNSTNPAGILDYKASCEPPVTLSPCGLFAIKQALEVSREERSKGTEYFNINAPFTVSDVVEHTLVDTAELTLN